MIFSLKHVPIVAPRLGRWLASAWMLSTAPSLWALTMPQRPSSVVDAQVSTQCIVDRSPPPVRYRGPHNYLAMVGPSPLRFAEAAPPLPPEPVIPKPVLPVSLPSESEPATVVSTPVQQSSSDSTPAKTELPPKEGNSAKPVSILPDDIQHEIRPEDVIPFFQFPAGGENVTVAVPFSAAQPRAPVLPASSATYQQK